MAGKAGRLGERRAFKQRSDKPNRKVVARQRHIPVTASIVQVVAFWENRLGFPGRPNGHSRLTRSHFPAVAAAS